MLAHLVPSYGKGTAQKVESFRSKMSPTAIRIDVRTPPRYPPLQPERMSATPQPTRVVRDRSHAHANRTRGGPGRRHCQPVTGRLYTGLTVTFSRPTESRYTHPNGSKRGSGRPSLPSTGSLSSLGLALHPHPVRTGAGCALTCTSRATDLAQWRLWNAFDVPAGPAPRTRAS